LCCPQDLAVSAEERLRGRLHLILLYYTKLYEISYSCSYDLITLDYHIPFFLMAWDELSRVTDGRAVSFATFLPF
jgi:hypothetical protein